MNNWMTIPLPEPQNMIQDPPHLHLVYHLHRTSAHLVPVSHWHIDLHSREAWSTLLQSRARSAKESGGKRKVTIASCEDVVLVGSPAFAHTFPGLTDVPRHETAGIAIVTRKSTARASAAICMGPVQDVTMKEYNISRIRRAGHLGVSVGDGRQLILVRLLIRSSVIVEYSLKPSRLMREFISAPRVERLALGADAEPQAPIFLRGL
jgi:hypothetical protein